MTASSEHRIPAGVAWEGPPPGPRPSTPPRAVVPDVLGRCEALQPSPESEQRWVALRHHTTEERSPVELRRLDIEVALAPEVEAHAAWAARFAHRHLAHVYGCETAGDAVYWVSERVAGANLADVAAACRKQGKAVPVGVALSVVHEVAQALGVLHVVGEAHGLVSNQAVVLGFDGVGKLVDLGLFRCLGRRASWARVLETVGPYLSPEQLLRGHLPDPKTDVFSLGMVLYECLTGEKRRRSFDEWVKACERGVLPPPSSLNVMISRELDAVVLRAVSMDRAQRFPTALAFAEALRETSGPFMWRIEQRESFVRELFDERLGQERTWVHEAQAEARRREEAARAEAALPPPLPESPPRPSPVPVVLHRPSPPRSALKPLPAPPPRAVVRPAPLAWTAGGLAVGLLLGAVVAFLRPMAATPPQAGVVEALPPPVVELEGRVSVDPPSRPLVSVPASFEAEPVAVAEVPAPPASAAPTPTKKRAKRRAASDAPLPPWLR